MDGRLFATEHSRASSCGGQEPLWMARMRARGIRTMGYLDDFFCILETKEEAKEAMMHWLTGFSAARQSALDWFAKRLADLQRLPREVQKESDLMLEGGMWQSDAAGAILVGEWPTLSGSWASRKAGEWRRLRAVLDWVEALLAMEAPAGAGTPTLPGKTIQCGERCHWVPLRAVPGSPLCPVQTLQRLSACAEAQQERLERQRAREASNFVAVA
ncbi:hypothetical protein CYMTET_55600 [Cymbomonas tetramitiformis]|uniref:Uncharacterized protein n=1 Tax=Cymbomonas tetramitiformis TaxID=36881 RepID=A0AAE0EMS9_9CHLO|nr:hypothetical protein CYMTET_55600 [Cymbomonas tetramitiformis]